MGDLHKDPFDRKLIAQAKREPYPRNLRPPALTLYGENRVAVYVDLYRLYNPDNGRHLVTREASEYNSLPGFGWTQEGVKLNAVS